MMNKTFSFKLHADGEGAVIKGYTAADYITDLYTEAAKETVTNNSITYNTAPTVSLMNDRLGGTTEDLNGGNIRYYGASPNNYVYFNCETYPDTNCETWRIIGIFDGKLKIMRNTSIGELAWDQDKNDDPSKSDYDNNWSTSTLQKLLNVSYYNGSEIITYYSNSSEEGTTTLDMTDIGIKNNTTRNMIANTTWNIGGWSSSYVFSNQIYGYERGTMAIANNPTMWTGKIALAYPSDYGYATDLGQCKDKNLHDYDDTTCVSNNWMKIIMTNNGSNLGWLLTPYANSSLYVWGIKKSGSVHYGYYTAHSLAMSVVAPVLYLNSDIKIIGGDGTMNNPFVVE